MLRPILGKRLCLDEESFAPSDMVDLVIHNVELLPMEAVTVLPPNPLLLPIGRT